MSRTGDTSVRDRLTRMEGTMSTLQEDFTDFRTWQHARAKEDDTFRSEMRLAINGQGNEPGILTRLDRLEQAETRRARAYWIVFGTAIAALCTALINILGRIGS